LSRLSCNLTLEFAAIPIAASVVKTLDSTVLQLTPKHTFHLARFMKTLGILVLFFSCSKLNATLPDQTVATPLIFADDPTQVSSSDKEASHDDRIPLRLTIADWFSPEYHGLSNTRGNIVVFRAYIPWSIGSIDQLSRISIPVTTSSAGSSTDSLVGNTPEGPSGLGDIEFYDLSQFKTRHGLFSIGPVFVFPTGTETGVGKGKWSVGPAFGFNTKQDNWKFGFFSQSYFSFAGDSNQRTVERTKLQPIIDYSLPHGWMVGTSDMNFTYDWIKGRSTNLPLGFEIGREFNVYSQRLKFSGQAEYNFANTSGSSAWTFRFTLEYLARL
jgi:hypothetical protein